MYGKAFGPTESATVVQSEPRVLSPCQSVLDGSERVRVDVWRKARCHGSQISWEPDIIVAIDFCANALDRIACASQVLIESAK